MYTRISYPKIFCLDNNGAFAVGYEIHTFKAGTSTALTTYSDRGLSVENLNPVTLNARGEADIYVGEAAKLIFTIPGGDTGSPIWSQDYIGEMQANLVTGSATPVTANNNYIVTTAPAVAALSNNFMLIMTPDLDNSDTIVPDTDPPTRFTGTGANDLTPSGPYIGSTSGSVFTVQIDAEATPDTFKWKKDGGDWTPGVAITGDAQILIEGFTVTFATITGHTLNDLWAITVKTPARVNLDTLGNLLVYKNKGGSVVALDGADMKAGYPAQLILNEALNAWLLINPATPVYDVATISAIRYRKNLTANYALLLDDQGRELSCTGTFTLTLLTCPEFANRFFYCGNPGTGIITVDAGAAYLIYGLGSRYFYIGPGSRFQFQTNGVDWHIMTSLGYPMLLAQQDVTAAASVLFTDLIPGIKYRLTYELLKVATSHTVYVRFNADAANYVGHIMTSTGAGAGPVAGVPHTVGAAIGQVVDITTYFMGSIDFETWVTDDHKVKALGKSIFYSTDFYGGDTYSIYNGAADLTSVSIVPLTGTVTGRVCLYQVG